MFHIVVIISRCALSDVLDEASFAVHFAFM